MGLSEKILNLCGYEIWPPTHNDPHVKSCLRIFRSASKSYICHQES